MFADNDVVDEHEMMEIAHVSNINLHLKLDTYCDW